MRNDWQWMRLNKALLMAALHAATLGAYGDFAPFETFLDGERLWDTTPDTFLTTHEDETFFRWLSANKEAARYPGYQNSPEMTFLGRKCWEIVVAFDQGKLSGVTLSLYNRGDAGDIDDAQQFHTLLTNIACAIEQWAADKGVGLPAVKLTGGKKIEKKAWVKNNRLALELRWSASERIAVADPRNPGAVKRIAFRGEYIQLAVAPFDPQNDPRKPSPLGKPPATATAKDVKANVKTNADGVVFIDHLPMVDQGQKGYCAVATTQRILGYYGRDIDQHVIAQLANTANGGGTNPEEMIGTLKRISVKFGVKVAVHAEFTVQRFTALVNDYNIVARRHKKQPLVLEPMIDVGAVYRAMDPAVLKEARCQKDKDGLRNFTSDIVKHVNAGIPLAWSVTLGLVPETPPLPQAFGGHMRIILGYDKALTTLAYSDSWGAGHAFKTMRLDDAWTITTGLYSFDPKK